MDGEATAAAPDALALNAVDEAFIAIGVLLLRAGIPPERLRTGQITAEDYALIDDDAFLKISQKLNVGALKPRVKAVFDAGDGDGEATRAAGDGDGEAARDAFYGDSGAEVVGTTIAALTAFDAEASVDPGAERTKVFRARMVEDFHGVFSQMKTVKKPLLRMLRAVYLSNVALLVSAMHGDRGVPLDKIVADARDARLTRLEETARAVCKSLVEPDPVR